MDRKLKTIGYVMIPRDLLLKAFDEHPEAGGDMDAFLRILTYVNYAEAVVKRESREVLCARGESVISYSQWAEILGWSLGLLHTADYQRQYRTGERGLRQPYPHSRLRCMDR